MGKPIKSISVPKERIDEFNQRLPGLLESAGMKGLPMSFSTLVAKLVFDAEFISPGQLGAWAAKENLKSSDRKYLILTLK